MLRRPITYTDFNGNTQTETHYFNLSRTETAELSVLGKGGLQEKITRIQETNDHETLVATFKELILLAYGRKSDDGRSFVKNQELRDEFSCTAAFDQLFYELATDADKGAEFLKGIIPADLTEGLPDKPVGPPPSSDKPVETGPSV